VVACWIDENLRLALQPAKRLRMQDPVAIALERRAKASIVIRPKPAARLVGAHGQRRQPSFLLLAHLTLEGIRDSSR
jgi:hypothetical protein